MKFHHTKSIGERTRGGLDSRPMNMYSLGKSEMKHEREQKGSLASLSHQRHLDLFIIH